MISVFINSNDADARGSIRVSVGIFLGLRTADKAGRGNSQSLTGSVRGRQVFYCTHTLCVCEGVCVCVCAHACVRAHLRVLHTS